MYSVWSSTAYRSALCALCVSWASCVLASDVEGFTEPYRDIDVAASESALLENVEVREGDRVQAGQLLAQLDASVLRASLEIVKATAAAEGRLESAEAEVKMQSEIVAKLHELRERSHASRQEVERAEAQLQIAEARRKAVQEEQQVMMLECQRTRVQLEQRRLISPIDGIVTRIFKDRGEFVSLADPVVLKVVQLDPLLVVFAVPTKQGRELSAGEDVEVCFAESENRTTGSIEFVSPTADPQSGTTRVRVRIPNPNELLPSGAPCRLVLPSPSAQPAGLVRQ
ncbi:MAG: efflux RND transporter periplasmic adaptor subunit [Planctomycetota bacterium]